MLLFPFEYDAADVLRRLYPNHGKKGSGISAHALAVQSLGCEDGGRQLILLLFGNQIAALLANHVIHQLISDAVHSNDFLFCNAGKVIVKGTAVHDVRRRFSDIGCFVHQRGRVSCACADSPFT